MNQPDPLTMDISIIGLSIAVLSAFRPELTIAYNRVFRRPTLIIEVAARLEVGFASLGRTIGMVGVLVAKHRPILVSKMWLELQRASDGTSVTFDAFGFRETTALLSGQNREVSPPYPFATEIDKPRPFSVVFNRRSEVDEMLEIKKPLVFAWLAWWQEVFQREKVAVPSPAASAFLAQKGAAVFQDFSATAPFLSAAEQFVNFLPWKADGYRLTLNVRVHGESTTYAKSWFMRMTQDDVDTLKVNGVRLAQETCSQPYAALLGEYVFVYPDYRDSP